MEILEYSFGISLNLIHQIEICRSVMRFSFQVVKSEYAEDKFTLENIIRTLKEAMTTD